MTAIYTNTAANNALRNLSIAQKAQAASSEKLASGLRINRAADDAAGLAISEGLKAQVNGTKQASRNAQEAINMIQVADSGLAEATSILQRMRILAVQGANDTVGAEGRSAIKTEIKQLNNELVRMGNTLEFNDIKLLDGTFYFKFQVGDSGNASDQLLLNLAAANLTNFAYMEPGFEYDTPADFANIVGSAALNIKTLGTLRARAGAFQNRLETAIKHLDVTSENLSAANSSIADTNMAAEMVKSTRASILSQASISVLAQANQAPQSILKLLA